MEEELRIQKTPVFITDHESSLIVLNPEYEEEIGKQLPEFAFGIVISFIKPLDSVQYGSDNQQLYDEVARSVVRNAMEGVTGTIFAVTLYYFIKKYGQTASGKTYAM